MKRAGIVCDILAVVPLLTAVPAGGQSPAASYWQALQRATSPSEVRAIAPPLPLDRALAGALAGLRRYELGSQESESRSALRQLEELAARRRGDADAQLALGLANAHGPAVRVRPFEDPRAYIIDRYGLGYGHAVRALRAALRHDGTRALAASELLQLGTAAYDLRLVALADSALNGIPSRDVLTARTDLLLFRNEVREALALLDSFPGRSDERVALLHRRAQALLRLGRQEAGTLAYFEGADLLDARTERIYYDAIAPILDERREVAAWQALRAGGYGDWLRHFWNLRAAEAGVTLGERLEQHYRRLAGAGAVYPLTNALELPGRIYQTRVDSRKYGLTLEGLMLVRHGDPRRFDICQLTPRPRPAGRDTTASPLGELSADSSLLASPAALEAYIPTGLRRSPDQLAAARELVPVALRSGCSMLGSGGSFSTWLEPWQADLRTVESRSLRLTAAARLAKRDSYYPVFDRYLSYAWELFAFHGQHGGTEVLAVVALPPASAGALRTTDHFSARVSSVLFDERSGDVVRADSVVSGTLPTPGRESLTVLLRTALATTMTGPVQYRVAVRDTGGGSVGSIVRGQMELRDLDGRGPQLSDLVLSPAADGGSWRRGAIAITPVPALALRAGEPLTLFYEIYGVAEDTPYRTEILVAKDEPGVWQRLRSLGTHRNVVSLRFDETADRPHPVYGLQVLRSVGTAELEPGEYRLQVTVTDLRTRRSTRRTRVLSVAASPASSGQASGFNW